MKTTIKLTEEQLNQIVKDAELAIDAKVTAEKAAIDKKAAADKLALRKKYEHYEISLTDETTTSGKRAKLDEERLIKFYQDCKGKVGDIQRAFEKATGIKPSYAGVNSALERLGLKEKKTPTTKKK